MKESSVYQAALREGEAQGEVKGRLAEARRMLRLVGQDLFGALDAASTARLEAIQDIGLLEDLLVRVRRCASWEDLLQDTPAPRAARRRR